MGIVFDPSVWVQAGKFRKYIRRDLVEAFDSDVAICVAVAESVEHLRTRATIYAAIALHQKHPDIGPDYIGKALNAPSPSGIGDRAVRALRVDWFQPHIAAIVAASIGAGQATGTIEARPVKDGLPPLAHDSRIYRSHGITITDYRVPPSRCYLGEPIGGQDALSKRAAHTAKYLARSESVSTVEIADVTCCLGSTGSGSRMTVSLPRIRCLEHA